MRPFRYIAVALTAVLAGCASEGELVVNQGVGITAVRSVCPAVGVPDYTGDITLFRDAGTRTASNIDMVATITDVRSTCNEAGEQVYAEATFNVVARRSDVGAAQQVTLPYFVSTLRGGNAIVTKKVGNVTLNFAPGEERTSAQGKAATYVNRADATLPDEIRERITRRRKPGDPDAALDPLADPQVREAVARATFEMLIGFQLSDDQLAYNATR